MSDNDYKINKFAYRELYYFCLRYGEYNNENSRKLIEQTAIEVDNNIYQPLLLNVTTGVTYEQMKACGVMILCGRRQFYEKRKKFFWILNNRKDS